MQVDMPISSMFNTITNTVGLYFNLHQRSESSLSDSRTTSVASTLSKAVSAESVDYERMILYEHNVSCKPDSTLQSNAQLREACKLCFSYTCVCVCLCLCVCVCVCVQRGFQIFVSLCLCVSLACRTCVSVAVQQT
jgi:hypothetical protein